MPVKKRIFCLLLAVVLALSVCPSVGASAELLFVAVNDAVPLTLQNAPYITGSGLLVPYTVFDAQPGGVMASFNEQQQMLYLLRKDKVLCFDMAMDVVVDENFNEYPSTAMFKDGLVYIPLAFSAAHFGLNAVLLVSGGGYPVLRFTTGSQVYDDATFLEKADALMAARAEQYEQEAQPGEPEEEQNPPPEPPPEEDVPPVEELEPATVYLALADASQMEDAQVILTRYGVRAACFLTEAEILEHPELVRTFLAAGCPLGVTVPPEEENAAAALRRANEALDAAVQRKTVLALLTKEQAQGMEGYCVFCRPEQPPEASEVAQPGSRPQSIVCTEDFYTLFNALLARGAVIRPLRETTAVQP